MAEKASVYRKTTEELLSFIQKSPTAFQAVETMEKRFLEAGFVRLLEQKPWSLSPGGRYFVTRNHSALIAFALPQKEAHKFHIIASHSDSPAFKLKENPELSVENAYVRLNVEKYGGMVLSSWLDRPLSVAGRLVLLENGRLVEKNVCVDRDLLLIPGLAIHMNREVNEGYGFNVQKDLLPLFSMAGDEAKSPSILELVAGESGLEAGQILSHELFLYNRMPGSIWGAGEEFVSAPRLDDLQCAFGSMEGFLQAQPRAAIAVHCVLDNEEVGSTTRQGAASTFLKDTLLRINGALGRGQEEYLMALADSFMISADNAHALHPNHTDKADLSNRPLLNKGIVIKYNANQKYCTDGVSGAQFKELCMRAQAPFQSFANRSDMAGGSTLGNISGTQVPVRTVDVGLPQLSMHSAYETAGVYDTLSFIRAAKVFFEQELCTDE